jgi:iron complex transport system ATP-binding protein
MSETLYIAENISFSYDRSTPVIDNVSVSINTNEVIAVIGPNGAGKSTLLKLLINLLRPDSGQIKFTGKNVIDIHPRELARHVSYLPQDDEIHFPFSVGEVVMLGRWPHTGAAYFDSPDDKLAAQLAMEKVGIEKWASRPVTDLSGGERARVLLARSLATQPDCLLLDEPASELDLKHRANTFSLLKDLSRENIGVVIVAHDIGSISRWADRMILMSDGKVIADDIPEKVLNENLLESAYGTRVKVLTDGENRAVFAVSGKSKGGG